VVYVWNFGIIAGIGSLYLSLDHICRKAFCPSTSKDIYVRCANTCRLH